VRCYSLVFFICASRYFGEQLSQVVVNGLGDTLTGQWWLVRLLWWVKQVL
jgi:hypothetical protein